MPETDSYAERECALATGSIKYLEAGTGAAVVVLHHSWGSPAGYRFTSASPNRIA